MKEKLKLLTMNKVWFIVLLILFIITTFSTFYLVYTLSLLNNIENLLRLIVVIILLILWLLTGLFIFKALIKRKKVVCIILTILMVLYSSISMFISFNIKKVYNKLSNITTSYTTYSTSLVTLSTNEVNNINDIGSSDIGIINDQNNIDSYQIPKEIIKDLNLTNNIKEYDSFASLINALYNEEIKYIFLPTNYTVMFENIEIYKNISSETKTIYTKQKKQQISTNISNKSLDEPFTILLMGTDSKEEDISNSSFNGDALILITFNPNTLNSTILSIPRDTYVPIACLGNNKKMKINSAAWYGESCMIDTIENFTEIEIDYYVKINFKGVVKLVDALGGINVDVPIDFCEQNSDRLFGNNLICLEKGVQTLNGEQALALSRHRKTINDFIRGQNQQLVVKATLNKLKDIRDLDTFYNLLDTIGKSMETNMTTDQILSLYNVGKDIILKSKDQEMEDILGMQRLYISGYDAYIYDYSMIDKQGTRLTLYQFVPYNGSIKDVSNAMKINLDLKEPEIIKSFSFDINNPYEETVIGKGYYNESRISLLPNFVGETKDKVLSWASARGINVNIEYITTDSNEYSVNEVTSQFPESNLDMDYFNKNQGLTIIVVEKINNIPIEFDYSLCNLEENKDNDNCKLEDFVGKSISSIDDFERKYRLSILINKIEILENDSKYDESKQGLIISQDVLAGTSLYDLLNKTITFEYIAYKENLEEETPNEEDNTPEPEIPGIPDNPENENSNTEDNIETE